MPPSRGTLFEETAGVGMIQQFTRSEQQHILLIMNAQAGCPECSAIRKKLEENIASMPAMQPAPVFFMEENNG